MPSLTKVAPALLAGLLLIGCCAATAPTEGLSVEERALYLMLAAELDGFVAKNYDAANGICVAIDGNSTGASPALLRALEQSVDGTMKLIAYVETSCALGGTFGNPPGNPPVAAQVEWLLFAAKTEPASGRAREWQAGFVCGGLCGWGHIYEVKIDGDRVNVSEIGDWIS